MSRSIPTPIGPDREGIVNLVIAIALPAAALAAHSAGEAYYVNLVSRIAILALAGVGLNLALGYGGLVSFGHAAFFGIGGYVSGIAAFHAFDGSALIAWPFAIGGTNQMLAIWIGAILLSGLAALVIGAISLRTEGLYFIMITLAFAQMIYYFAISWPAYGGEDGLPIYLRNVFPIVDSSDPLTFFLICYACLMLAVTATFKIVRGRFGLALETARMNATRLATAGIAPFPVKLTAFVISGAMTGLAGALFADLNGFVSPSMLNWHTSGEIMVFVILGGVGRLFGPVLGAALFVLLETFIGGITERWQFFLGFGLLGVVLFAKGGVISLVAGRKTYE